MTSCLSAGAYMLSKRSLTPIMYVDLPPALPIYPSRGGV